MTIYGHPYSGRLLCGDVSWSAYLGDGSEAERQRAASLPLCRRCAARAEELS